MSIFVKAGAGLIAGVVAGVLGLAFLPQVEPTGVTPRQAVGKPQFVATSAPTAKIESAPVAVAALPMSQKPEPPPQLRTDPAPEAPDPVAVRPELRPSAPPPVVAALAAKPVVAKTLPAKALSAKTLVAKPLVDRPAVEESRAAAPASDAFSPPANEAAARWSVRGLLALAKGDISAARLYLMRAAEAGDPRAWIALADTYDPAMLTRLGVVGAPGDPQRARQYLVKAAAAGLGIAKDRMAALDQDPNSVH